MEEIKHYLETLIDTNCTFGNIRKQKQNGKEIIVLYGTKIDPNEKFNVEKTK